MTLVVGTAGHIDHGKTTLLRALTGIDADRLPEEQRRGMTIDVGYAHMTVDGRPIDFVDVPGHDRLVGNMLVGAGEVDAAMLVVAADDGPRPQTIEHLELLDALGIAAGLAVITKTDLADAARVEVVTEEVRRLLAATALAGAPILTVAAATGEGLDALRGALAALSVPAQRATDQPRLAVDRVFSVRGRGAVVTGTLHGGTVRAGDILQLVPGGREVRVREVQVHGSTVEEAGPGRTALNLAAVPASELRRGLVIARPGTVVASDRLLVALRAPATRPVPSDRAALRLHLGTDQVEARVGRAGPESVDLDDGRVTALLRLSRPMAVATGDRFVLRDAGRGGAAAGGLVLDAEPARGVSRKRATPERVAALAGAVTAGRAFDAARLELHGRVGTTLARDVEESVVTALLEAAVASVDGLPLAAARTVGERAIRRLVTATSPDASATARQVVDRLLATGRLAREGDRVGLPGRLGRPPDAREEAAMTRLVAALDRPAPPPLTDAARDAGCPPAAVASLERTGRIVRVDTNLAWSTAAWTQFARTAAAMASAGPLSPAELRDATGTSRKYVMALLEDLNGRGILVRTDAGHRPGPRAATLDDRSSVA